VEIAHTTSGLFSLIAAIASRRSGSATTSNASPRSCVLRCGQIEMIVGQHEPSGSHKPPPRRQPWTLSTVASSAQRR